MAENKDHAETRNRTLNPGEVTRMNLAGFQEVFEGD